MNNATTSNNTRSNAWLMVLLGSAAFWGVVGIAAAVIIK